MILSKQLGVFLNYVHNRFKLFFKESMEAAGYNITAEQFLLLDTLWNEGPLSQQQIADMMLKDKNSVVKLVDSLESRGLVVRRANPDDRRQNIVSTTPECDKMRDEVKDYALDTVNRITNGLTDDEIAVFIKAMDIMAQNMDKDVDLLAIARTLPIRKSAAGN